MIRAKTEQSTLIELIKKKNHQILNFIRNLKIKKQPKLDILILQMFPITKLNQVSQCEIFQYQIKLMIQTINIKQNRLNRWGQKPIRINNKTSRFFEIQENKIFKKQFYTNPSQVYENINQRNNISNQRIYLKIQKRTQKYNNKHSHNNKQFMIQLFYLKLQMQNYLICQIILKNSKFIILREGYLYLQSQLKIQMFGSRTVKKLISSVKPWVNQLQQNKQSKFKRISLEMIQSLNHIHKLKLTLQEFSKRDAFPKAPFKSNRGEKFFSLCKMTKGDQVSWFLEKEKYLVCQYDPSVKTALHRCCVRNCRAAIFNTFQKRCKSRCIRYDRYHKADSWNKGILDYNEAVTNNIEGKIILQQGRSEFY
ncbi:unnamed protein product [Paramecium sonneborni]|uniref:Uncharacterized protein n=1 Tax=Paramecium sonneborni TaxID=65129 RepID=A0A8S1KV13_9CILI|nr:unnamed protein product [Paramecium sonneborni]